MNHPFWQVLTVAVLICYSLVTIFVAVRGAGDLRKMLRDIQSKG